MRTSFSAAAFILPEKILSSRTELYFYLGKRDAIQL